MGAETEKSLPPWPSRFLAAACYLGLAPPLSLLRRRCNDAYFLHHRNQALITVLLLFLVLLLLPVYLPFELYLVRHYARPHLFDLRTIILPGLGLWTLIVALGMGTSLAGSTRPIPLIARLGSSRRLTSLAWMLNSLLLALAVLVVGVAFDAFTLVRGNAGPAPVYYLYDDRDMNFLGGCQPTLHSLFCYRISRVAAERWGPGSVVVAPLTEENLWAAVSDGQLVILISHGQSGAFVLADGRPVLPTSIGTHGKDLKCVYMSACWGGERANEWKERLAPAEVVTFNRLSAPLEHLWWLWFDAPHRLKKIH